MLINGTFVQLPLIFLTLSGVFIVIGVIMMVLYYQFAIKPIDSWIASMKDAEEFCKNFTEDKE